MKTPKIGLAALVFHFVFLSLGAQEEMTVTNLPNTAGLGISNFEPENYTYDFIAPLKSSLLCKNGQQYTIPSTNVIGSIASNAYEAQAADLSSNGTVGSPSRVWFLANGKIILNQGFMAAEGSFFSAETLVEETHCQTPSSYIPSETNRYFQSVFGPRMTADNGVISRIYDFHQGEDMVDKDEPAATMPDIFCMCDGTIKEIQDFAGEKGKSVRVKCDQSFLGPGDFGKIYVTYRHLSEYAPNLVDEQPIKKGDLVGKMGGTGAAADNPHLHLSIQRWSTASKEYLNVHPMRAFNPTINHHLIHKIDESVKIFLLTSNPADHSAIFRIAVPLQQANIRAIIIKNETYNQIADFEFISSGKNPDVNAIGDLRLFAFPFNRQLSAYQRFNSIRTDLQSKLQEHPGNSYPINNEGIFQTPAFVLDIKATNLPANFQNSDFEVYILDIWGNGVKGVLP